MLRLIFITLWMFVALPASASDVVTKHIPGASKVGSGTLSIFLWEVYDATLYAKDGSWNRNEPFALNIDYKRTIDGVDIADRSAEEIKSLGYGDENKLANWLTQMREIFPDVTPESTITGLYQPNQPTIFYHNAARIGTIDDPEFGKWFFDIWLSKKTPEPKLRAALLGR